MISALLSGFFSLILTLLSTILQVLLLPLNALFDGIFPDLTSQITQVIQGFSDALSGLSWAISVIPPIVRTTVLFILTIEAGLFVVLRSTKLTTKLWSLLQKIKLW